MPSSYEKTEEWIGSIAQCPCGGHILTVQFGSKRDMSSVTGDTEDL